MSGATSYRRCQEQQFDAILLSVGVNDVLKLERSGRFRRQLLKLLRDLQKHSPQAVIGYLGLPPLDEFPRLRRPLRWIVGYRVRRFDAVARDALSRMPNVVHIPMTFSPRPDMFSDGWPPSVGNQSTQACQSHRRRADAAARRHRRCGGARENLMDRTDIARSDCVYFSGCRTLLAPDSERTA